MLGFTAPSCGRLLYQAPRQSWHEQPSAWNTLSLLPLLQCITSGFNPLALQHWHLVLYQGKFIVIVLRERHVPRHFVTGADFTPPQTGMFSTSGSHVTPQSAQYPAQVTWLSSNMAIVKKIGFLIVLKREQKESIEISHVSRRELSASAFSYKW